MAGKRADSWESPVAVAQRWNATLAEVRVQADRRLQQGQQQQQQQLGGSTWCEVLDGVVEEVDTAACPSDWRPQQWQNAFTVLFFETPPHIADTSQQDDLLFFLYVASHQAAEPFFVRRKGSTVPADLAGGPQGAAVDWAASTLLNLVLQTSFTLTVATCWHGSLHFLAEGLSLPPDVHKVSKAVFASPTRVAVNLDSSRGAQAAPVPSYPDICFAVDNFDDAFKSLVVADPGHCYVVVLVATAGLAFQTAPERPFSPPTSSAAGRSPFSLAPLSPATSPQNSVADLHEAGSDSFTAASTSHQQNSWQWNHQREGAAAAEAATLSEAMARAFSDPLLAPSARHLVTEARAAVEAASSSSGGGPQAPPAVTSSTGSGAEDGRPPGQPHDRVVAAEAGASSSDMGGLKVLTADQWRRSAGLEVTRQHSAAEGGHGGTVLFSGFVSYEQLLEAMGPPKGSLLKWRPSDSTHRVLMRGPGGRGSADVAVTSFPRPADSGHLTAGPASPVESPTGPASSDFNQQASSGADMPAAIRTSSMDRKAAEQRKGGGGAGGLLARTLLQTAKAAAHAARGLAQNAIAVQDRSCPATNMRCALMNLSLPVDGLVRDLLAEPAVPC